MKRSIVSAFLFLAALTAALPASALRIGNTGPDGYPVVIPSVRKLTPADGLFKLPAKLGVAAPAGLNWQPLRRWYAATVPNGAAEAAGEVRCRFTLTTQGVPASVEGYRLSVAPDGITVAARDVRGLFYGMQTLCWFLRNRADDAALKCCTVEDWPALRQRGVLWELNEVPPSQTDRLCEVLDALGAMKYNMIYADFADNFPLSISGDFNRPKGTFSRSDIEKLKAAAKRNHIELVPNLQVASHTWWMTRHKEWEKLVEGKVRRDWSCSYCLSNPRVDEIVHTVIRETVELLQPKRFNLNLDEIDGSPFRSCPKCKAKPPVELLMAHVRPIQKMLLDRGILPVVAFDQFSLNPYRAKHDLVPALDQMDHRVEVIDWEYTRNTSRTVFDDLTKRGFKVVYMSWLQTLYNTMNLPRLAARVGALGCIVTYWLSMPATLDRFPTASVDGYPATVCQAVYSWNSDEKDFVRLPFDSHRQIRRLLDPAGVPHFAAPGKPLAIDAAFNTAIGEGSSRFPQIAPATAAELAAETADDPAHFRVALHDGKIHAAVLAGSEKDPFPAELPPIPINSKIDGASFLLAATPENGFLVTRRMHPVIGDITICYAQKGRTVKVPLRYRYNIHEWNSLTGAYDARIVARANDAAGALTNLYSLDWKNPLPKLTVKEIRISSRRQNGIAPIFFGISLYGAAKEVAGLPGKGAIRFGGTAEAVPAPSFVVNDFEKGLGKIRIDSTEGAFQGKRSQKIVDLPGRGKALEITLPALKPGRHGRVTLDLPIPADAAFETMSYDVKCDNPGAILRADLYIVGKPGALGLLNFDRGFDTNWRRILAPRSAFREKERGGVERGSYDHIRIGFFLCNNEGPVTFLIDNIQLYREALPCRFDIREPLE